MSWARRLNAQKPTLTLCCLFCLFSPNLVNAEDSFDSIHFVALPYLHVFESEKSLQTHIFRNDKNQQDLSAYGWMMNVTSLADFHSHRSQLQAPDSGKSNASRFSQTHIIIPLPQQSALSLPLQSIHNTSTPLWIQYLKTHKVRWHSPSLTPNIATQVLAEQKKTDRLAERMADRAFYFGYDTNDDALE